MNNGGSSDNRSKRSTCSECGACSEFVAREAQKASIDFSVRFPLWNFVPECFRRGGLPVLEKGVFINVLFSGFGAYSREAFRHMASSVQFLCAESDGTKGENGEKGENCEAALVPFSVDYFASCEDDAAEIAEAEFGRGFYRYRDFISATRQRSELADEYLPLVPMPFSFTFSRGENRVSAADKLAAIAESGKPSLNIVFVENGDSSADEKDETSVREVASKVSVRCASGGGDSDGCDSDCRDFCGSAFDSRARGFRTVVFRLTGGRWECVYDSFFGRDEKQFGNFGLDCGEEKLSVSGSENETARGCEPPKDEDSERVRRFVAYRNALYIKEKQEREGKFVPFEKILEETLFAATDVCSTDMQSVCAFSGLIFYCAAAGVAVVKAENPSGKTETEKIGIGKSALAKFRDIFVVSEHYRWNACMITGGYVPARKSEILSEKKVGKGGGFTNGIDKAAKKHGNLTTFSGLDLFADMISERDGVSAEKADVKAFDAQLIDHADELLSFAGLKIVRIAR